MADDVYYSALHWAKKAEASAKEAAANSQASSKVIQLGFDGSLEGGVLVFRHAPGGSEIPYSLVDDVEYEIDLNYANTGSLADNVQIRIKNGGDTINFVSAVHKSSTESATVGDMKAVMRFNSSTGYRWLFKAAYKIAPNGAKVFLLYPVIYNDEAVKALQTADAQNVKLTGNQTIGGVKTFTGNVVAQKSGSSSCYFLKNTALDYLTNPSASQSQYIVWHDKNGKDMSHVSQTISTNGAATLGLTASTYKTDGTRVQGSMGIIADRNGNVYTTAPTPATNDSSTKIATTANVDAKITAQAVKLTGNQTIAGSKTFSSSLTTKTGGSAMLKGVLPNNTVGTNPSSDTNVYVAGVDSGSKDQSYINFVVKTSGEGQVTIAARSNSSSDRGSSGIQIARKLDGTSWTSIGTTTASAPTPATTDNSTKIATTAFVNNKFQVVSALPSSPTAGVFYFIKE